jgi:hypothetical protein
MTTIHRTPFRGTTQRLRLALRATAHRSSLSLVVAPVIAAITSLCLFASPAPAQMVNGNTYTAIRPLVAINAFSSGSSKTALGIFDTGDTSVFIPPETNSVWGIGLSAPAGATVQTGGAASNYGMVGVASSFSVGGFMGGAVNGPEVNTAVGAIQAKLTSPTHTFTSVSLGPTTYIQQTGIKPSLTYFNAVSGAYTEPNIGAGFYNGIAGTSTPIVAEVDPTNATWLPFASGNVAASVPNPPGPNVVATNQGTGAVGSPLINLKPPTSALDQATSDISYYAPGDPNVPTIASNSNLGFMIALALIPVDPTTGLPAANGSFLTVAGATKNGATRGMRPFYAPTAASNPLGLPSISAAVGYGSYMIDTGAPGTSLPTAADEGVIGANILNQYGQFFDFSSKQLILFAPQSAADENIVGPGILFDVGSTSTGLANTGVNQLANFGSIPVNNSNGAAIPSDGISGQQSSAIFSTQLTHSNKAYVSGTAALGLQASDQMAGLSMGADQIGTPTKGVLIAAQPATPNPSVTPDSGSPGVHTDITNGLPGPDNCALLFSVDPNSQGVAGSGVAAQAALGKQSAQMYIAMNGNFIDTGHLGETNTLKYSGDLLGLGPDAGPGASAVGRGHVDQLGDFVLESQRGYYTAPGSAPNPAAVPMSSVQRNIDPTITSESSKPLNTGNGVTLPAETFASAAGPASDTPPAGIPSNGDNYGQSFDTYFTLGKNSPSLGANNSADIFVNKAATGANPTTGFKLFADNTQMGLDDDDVIDALTLSRPALGSNTALDVGDPDPSTASGFDDNFFGNFGGVDPFNGGTSDYDLFTLARGSPDLSIFDPVIGRDLSAADVFVSDFDDTFALYATAESLGLNPTTDEITGLKPLPYADVPEPAMLSLLGLSAFAALRRRNRAA